MVLLEQCFDCFIKDLITTAVGAVLGIIGSILLFRYIIPWIYPIKIDISDKIAFQPEGRGNVIRYRIKVINRTKHRINNITAELQLLYRKPGANYITAKTIPLVKSTILELSKYSSEDRNFEFNYRFLVSHKKNIIDLRTFMRDNAASHPKLKFRISATHSITGFSNSLQPKYYILADFEEGNFMLSEDFRIQQRQQDG